MQADHIISLLKFYKHKTIEAVIMFIYLKLLIHISISELFFRNQKGRLQATSRGAWKLIKVLLLVTESQRFTR